MASNQGQVPGGVGPSNIDEVGTGSPTYYLNLQDIDMEQPDAIAMDQADATNNGMEQPDATATDQADATNIGEAQASDEQRRRSGRGPSKMPKGVHNIVQLSAVGEPAIPASALGPYRTSCGVLARDNVPISYRSWTGRRGDPWVVPDDLKDLLWDKLKEVFQFPQGSELVARKRALYIMCTAWKNWKTLLNKNYVKKNETPNFNMYPKIRDFWEDFVAYKNSEEAQIMSQKNKTNADKNMYPHRLGTGGYVKKIPAWDKCEEELTRRGVIPATAEFSERSKHWLLGRGASVSEDGSLSFRSDRTEEVSRKISDAHVQSSQGFFTPRRENDELTVALGNKEHPGRTRGVGLVPWKEGFPADASFYKRPKRIREDQLDRQIQDAVARALAEQREQLDKAVEQAVQKALSSRPPLDDSPRNLSHGVRKSSCASTGIPEEHGLHFPVDDITEPTPCKLHLSAHGITIKVADGRAWPCGSSQVLHCRPIPPGFARVEVDNVLRQYRKMEVEIPGEDEKNKLGENVHGFLAWRKSLIKFDSDNEDDDDDDQPHSPYKVNDDADPPAPARKSPTPPPAPARKSPTPPAAPKQNPTPPPAYKKNQTSAPSQKPAPSNSKSRSSVKSAKPPKKLPAEMTEEERKKEISACVTSHFRKVPSPKKTKVDVNAQKFFLSKGKTKETGRSSEPSKMSDYERISRKQYLKTASADALTSQSQKDAAEQLRAHAEGLRWKFFLGQPLVEPAHLDHLTTQLRRVHQWYMQQCKEGVEALAVQYKEADFHNGDNIFWVLFVELYMLYQQDALDVNVLRMWTL